MTIDVHVLLQNDSDDRYWEECRASLDSEPIQLHVLDAVEGDIGKARTHGFRHGAAPYVSFVDPDDVVVPGTFQACLDALAATPGACGAYTDEILIDAGGNPIGPGIWSGRPWNPLLMLEPKYMHHVLVMRRSFVEPYLEELESRWPNLAEFTLKGLLCQNGPWIHVDRVGYHWRQYERGRRPPHQNFPIMGLYAARWRIIPILHQAARRHRATLEDR